MGNRGLIQKVAQLSSRVFLASSHRKCTAAQFRTRASPSWAQINCFGHSANTNNTNHLRCISSLSISFLREYYKKTMLFRFRRANIARGLICRTRLLSRNLIYLCTFKYPTCAKTKARARVPHPCLPCLLSVPSLFSMFSSFESRNQDQLADPSSPIWYCLILFVTEYSGCIFMKYKHFVDVFLGRLHIFWSR